MIKEDNYEKVFSNKINGNNIEIIKKFFVFPSNKKNHTQKPYTSLSAAKRVSKLPQTPQDNNQRKGNSKFPAGFQGLIKFAEDEPLLEQKIVVKSKRAPTNELSSFLLGLTNRINKQSQERKLSDNEKEEKPLAKTSPSKKINYGEIVSNLTQIRNQHKNKLQQQYLSQQRPSTKKQLPMLQRKNSQVREKTKSISPNSALKCKRDVKTDSRLECEGKETTRMNYSNNVSNITPSINQMNYRANYVKNKISVKIIKLQEQQPTFLKGYLSYDLGGKDFIEQNIQNLDQPPEKFNRFFSGLTATNFIVINRYTLRTIVEKKSNESIQIASLTKIMTCYLCLLICKKYSINMNTQIVRISDRAADMVGTSAQLQAGDMISVSNLLYGLMLPSGNDASVAIAESMGKIIQKYKNKPTRKTHYETFIWHMNLLAKQIGIQQQYQNSSGLSQHPNYSTPKAISVLTALAMRHDKFKEVVNCKQYQIEVKNERYGLSRKLLWKNTNKLLWKDDGWVGVKTGTTESAGPCLMACRDQFLISVYNCDSLGKRFIECAKIYDKLKD